MKKEKESNRPLMARHVQELMTNAELYGWESVRSYHTVRLHQLQNGRVQLDDMETKLQFCCSLVWHPTHPSSKTRTLHNTAPQKRAGKEGPTFNIAAKPVAKICSAFHQGTCTDLTDNPKELRICSYC